MNRLSISRRVGILNLLVEGVSLRATSRITGTSLNTVYKLAADTGEACEQFHHEQVREVPARRVQCDEIWSFVYAKRKNAPHATAAPHRAGDVWTWTAIDPDTKLLIAWMVGDRGSDTANAFMSDLRFRLLDRVQLTTDGHAPYIEAVERTFGSNVDYGRLVKTFSVPEQWDEERGRRVHLDISRDMVMGMPALRHVSTSLVERHNLTMRTNMRRFTRRTNGHSKRFGGHRNAVALHAVWYNWVRPHRTLKGETPAMASGLSDAPQSMAWLASISK